MKLCLVGCGGHANAAYAESLIKYKRVFGADLAGCCDPNAEAAEAFRTRVGFTKAYTDMKEMITAEKPESVFLVTPYQLTADIAVAVMGMGVKNIMLEKPPGVCAADCDRIAKTAAETGTFHYVAFNRRRMPLVRALMDELYSGGTPPVVRHIDYKMYRVRRFDEAFHTTAIHGLDLVAWVARGGYASGTIGYTPLPGGENVRNVRMDCEMSSGVTAHLDFCPVTGVLIERLEVICDHATFYVKLPVSGTDAPGELVRYEGNQPVKIISGADCADGAEMFEANGFYAQVCDFLEQAQSGKHAPGEDALAAKEPMRAADCMARSDGAL